MPYERSVQSSIELPSVDTRLSAPHVWCSGTRNDRYRKVFHEFLVLRYVIISKRASSDEVFFFEKRPNHCEKRYIERQNKVHSNEGKWSGCASGYLFQRRSYAMWTRGKHRGQRWRSPSCTANPRARAEQRITNIYIRVVAREALSRGT